MMVYCRDWTCANSISTPGGFRICGEIGSRFYVFIPGQGDSWIEVRCEEHRIIPNVPWVGLMEVSHDEAQCHVVMGS